MKTRTATLTTLKTLAIGALTLGAIAIPIVPQALADEPTTPTYDLAAMRARLTYRVGVGGLVASSTPAPAPVQNIVVQQPVAPVAPVVVVPAAKQVLVPGNYQLTNLPANFYYPAAQTGDIKPYEQQMFETLNAERAKAGLAPLAWDPGLAYIARVRTMQMGQQNYFGHVDPFGYRMWIEIINRFGLSYRKAGENLVANGYAPAETATLAMEGLMNSPTHRANILDPMYTGVGIGLFENADGYKYYAQIFIAAP